MAAERSTVDARIRFIVVNLGIVAGLAFELYRGAPIVAVVISGFLIFVFANVLMIRKYKAQARS